MDPGARGLLQARGLFTAFFHSPLPAVDTARALHYTAALTEVESDAAFFALWVFVKRVG